MFIQRSIILCQCSSKSFISIEISLRRFAFAQATCNVDTCVFRLTDQSKWKAMSVDAIASVNTPGLVLNAPIMPELMANTLDPVALSNDLERQMRALIVQHRKVNRTTSIGLIFDQLFRLGSGLYNDLR